jgi:hypothetical protein
MGSRGSGYEVKGNQSGVPEGMKAEDMSGFTMFVKKGWAGDKKNTIDRDSLEIWDLDESDILTVGYDEDGNAYAVDKKGNPIERLKEDPYETHRIIGEGDTLDEAQGDYETRAEEALDEYNNSNDNGDEIDYYYNKKKYG